MTLKVDDDELKTTEKTLTICSLDGISQDLTLLYVQDPKKSSFSRNKKQCDLWEYVWGSSFLLSSLLLHCGQLIKEKKILEIGGGHGVCSLICSMLGAQVTMTDLVLDATKLCEKSAVKNKCSENLSFMKLDWNKLETVPSEEYDMILGSDVLFFRGCVKPVAKTLQKALKPGGIALIADPCRLNEEDFVTEVEECGLQAKLWSFKEEIVKLVAENLAEEEIVKVKHAKLIFIEKKANIEVPESQAEAEQFLQKISLFVKPNPPTFIPS